MTENNRTFKLTIPYTNGSEASELEGVRRFQFTDPQGQRWEIVPAHSELDKIGFMIRKLDYGTIAAIAESSNQLRIEAGSWGIEPMTLNERVLNTMREDGGSLVSEDIAVALNMPIAKVVAALRKLNVKKLVRRRRGNGRCFWWLTRNGLIARAQLGNRADA